MLANVLRHASEFYLHMQAATFPKFTYCSIELLLWLEKLLLLQQAKTC